MSINESAGSPTLRRTANSRSFSQENALSEDQLTNRLDNTVASLKKSITALTTSKLVNQASSKLKINHDSMSVEANPVDKLLAKLSEQQALINKQHEALKNSDEAQQVAYARTVEYISTTSTAPPTEVSTTIATPASRDTSPSNVSDDVRYVPGTKEVALLKAELEAARGKIARMDKELAQTRITTHTINQAIGTTSEVDYPMQQQTDEGLGSLHLQSIASPQVPRENSWTAPEDTRSDTSDAALSANGFNRARGFWNSANRPNFGGLQGAIPPFQAANSLSAAPWVNRSIGHSFADGAISFSDPINDFHGERINQDADFMMAPPITRRNQSGGRFNNRSSNSSFAYAGSNSSYDGYAATPAAPYAAVPGMATALSSVTHPMNMGLNGNMSTNMSILNNYHQQPIGTPLSPHAAEFTSSGPNWKSEVGAAPMGYFESKLWQLPRTEVSTYLPTTEPLNYRRLLDRTVNCNWRYIVDKIVCSNDQQASIFLQQKLKIGTTEQKYDIVEAIVAQAYSLMINRFGNFLVQRCFEHGTPEQVIKIAEAIRGNTLNLSMDAFGCHVVQKAFDSVPEDYKAIMVHELLRRIPETVIHRYACHVWQKLFELRWIESPPQIMKYVNEALRGMWHEVALGETGSLVVQNIFENCLEEDKRPCIEEVLASIDIVAHGQFGNWCIQHICEHGAPADRSRAIDHVIRYASEYSMDQFASKVVEKCLKIGGPDFLGRYLDRVCEGRLDRPRIPLIDIASDQYGNYLIQYILTHSNPQHREVVAQHIRKHMVSLRGSKFGSRVGMLCTNPAIQTRPGPGAGPAIGAPGPRTGPPQNPRFGGAYR